MARVLSLFPAGEELGQDGAKVEPTGVGDAFRAGFLAALEWELSLERAAQVGCLLAVYVVEKVGPYDEPPCFAKASQGLSG